MAVNNDNNKNQKSSNDISEMLRLLRESVEKEKKEINVDKEKDKDVAAADDEIKANLERVFEEVSLDTLNDDDEDDILDEDDEDVPSWFELEGEDEEDEDEILSDDEEESDDIVNEADDEESDVTEDEATSEETADEPAEEDPDSDDPWYDSTPAPINAEEAEDEPEAVAEDGEEESEEIEAEEQFEEDEEEIVLTMEMKPVLIEANPEVQANAGRVAMMRGPVVYCLEGHDNGERLQDLRIGEDAEAQAEYNETVRMPVVSARGWRRKAAKGKWLYRPMQDEMEEVRLTFVPYYAFANRGKSDIQVWTLKK